LKDKTQIIIITALVTSLLAGAGAFQYARVREGEKADRLQEQVNTLREENENLTERQEALEIENSALREGNNEQQGAPAGQITFRPKSGWEKYFPAAETTTLAGETVSKVRELLGEPPVLIRSIAANPQFSREIWVYHPYAEDPTGLYLFFKGGKLHSSMLNEFSGLYTSGLLDQEDFWLK